jgi:thioredoxin 2
MSFRLNSDEIGIACYYESHSPCNGTAALLQHCCKTFATKDESNQATEKVTKEVKAMQVVTCQNCGTKNRVDETRLVTNEAKCGKCGVRLELTSASNGKDSQPLIVSDDTFDREVMGTLEKPVLVDCWAPWCGPCRVIGPVMDQLASESQGRYRIAKLNVDDNPQTASRYQIASIPTILIFKDGKLIDRLIGAQPKQTMVERLRLASQFGARA